jgi:hypothetical protein
MAIDFPNTPTTGQLYTVGNRSWRWDGTAWRGYSIPTMYRQDAAPASPIDGDQWFETDTGRMFVRYGTAWVELGNATDVAGALQPSQVTALSAVTSLTSDDVFPVVDGPSGAVASSKITYGNLVTNMSSSLAPGLVHITTATASGTSSFLNVVGCFSSTYTNYKITMSNTSTTTADDIYVRMLNGTTPVTTGTYGWSYLGLGTRNVSANNIAYDQSVGGYTGVTTFNAPNEKHHSYFDVMSPFVATRTFFLGQAVGLNSQFNAFNYLNGGFYQESGTSFDGFQVRGNAGYNLTTTVRVYGYREA